LNADGSGAGFRDWVAARLDPLETVSSAHEPHRSDFDLDGGGGPIESPLTPAAVLVGLVERPGGLNVILTRRADTLRRHTGQIALPGGRCDPGETPWGAALREAHEEIGLDPGLVTLAGLSTPYRTGTGYFVTPVVGFVAPGYRPDPNPAEVADVFETPFEFLMDPTNHEAKEHQTPEGARRRYWAMTWDERYIWGATAGMLRALYHRLYGDEKP
jgi:8-oxo-dGTP pyrophosphatase MutT (NUDIX family)